MYIYIFKTEKIYALYIKCNVSLPALSNIIISETFLFSMLEISEVIKIMKQFITLYKIN